MLGEGEGHPFGWQTFTHMNSVQWCSLLQVQVRLQLTTTGMETRCNIRHGRTRAAAKADGSKNAITESHLIIGKDHQLEK